MAKQRIFSARTLWLGIAFLVVFVVGITMFGAVLYNVIRDNNAYASTGPCAVSDKLVNECRPWLGATAYGYPQVAADNLSQFKYLESRVGRQLDVFHEYNAVNTIPFTNAGKAYLQARPNGILYANWKPADKWRDAAGGNSAVNARIDAAADAAKAFGKRKLFLAIHAEPENDITPGTASACKTLKGNFGSTADYRNMWRNVRDRFAARGANNVVWVMNYMGYSGWDCAVNDLWPGNDLIDWITWDPYGYKNEHASQTMGRFYRVLEQKSDANHAYTSKAWGIGEFSAGDTMAQAQAYTFYDQMAGIVQSNTLPRLKLYMVFDHTNPNPILRVAYGSSGAYDASEQKHFNNFANAPIFKINTKQIPDPIPSPADTDRDGVPDSRDQCPAAYGPAPSGCPITPPVAAPPATTPAPAAPPAVAEPGTDSDSDGSEGYTSETTAVDELAIEDFTVTPAEDTQSSIQVSNTPGQDPIVSGTINVSEKKGNETTVTVSQNQVAPTAQKVAVDTTCLPNGTQTLTAAAAGKEQSTSLTIQNKTNAWENFRNQFCAQLGGNKTLANAVAGTLVGVPATGTLAAGWLGLRWLRLWRMYRLG